MVPMFDCVDSLTSSACVPELVDPHFTEVVTFSAKSIAVGVYIGNVAYFYHATGISIFIGQTVTVQIGIHFETGQYSVSAGT